MKTLLFILGFLFLVLSCQNKPDAVVFSPNISGDIEAAVVADTTPKATAIFWVDKENRGSVTSVKIRTAKAKVYIDSIGKVKLHSFTKEQTGKVQRYLHYRLEIFRVSRQMLDSGYINPGEQYVQLRYIPNLADRFK